MDRDDMGGAPLQWPAGEAILATGQWLSEAPKEAFLSDVLRVKLRFARPWPLQDLSPEFLNGIFILLTSSLCLPISLAFIGNLAHGSVLGVVVAVLIVVLPIAVAVWAAPSRWKTSVDIGTDGICIIRTLRSAFVSWHRIRSVAEQQQHVILATTGRVWSINAFSVADASRLTRVIVGFRRRALSDASRRPPPRTDAATEANGYRLAPERGEQDWLLDLADGTLPLSRRLRSAGLLLNSGDPVTLERAKAVAWASSDPAAREALLGVLFSGPRML